MEKNKFLGVVIGSFLTIIIGVVLISSLAQQNAQVQTLTTSTNDQFTVSNTTCTRVTTGCIDSLTSVGNATNTYVLTQLANNATLCTTSNGNQDGIILPTAERYNMNGATANATYQESSNCMYVKDSTSRTLAGIIIVFFAIAIVLGALYWLRESGMLDWF